MMEPSKIPSPEEVEAVVSGFGSVGRYIIGAIVSWIPIIGVWIWRASKAHTTLQQLDARVAKVEDEYAPLTYVDGQMAACRDKQSRIHEQKLHDIVLDLKEEQEHTNKNIYLLLGAQGITPVAKKAKRPKDLRNYTDESEE